MVETARVPILHIADAVLADLARRGATGPIGLLATAATVEAGFYQERLGAAGYACVLPGASVMTTCVLPAIDLVKRNRAAEAEPLLTRAALHLNDLGAETVLLACTELPIALAAATDPPPCLDATAALARGCIDWHRDHG
jgi:aspartate racemase